MRFASSSLPSARIRLFTVDGLTPIASAAREMLPCSAAHTNVRI